MDQSISQIFSNQLNNHHMLELFSNLCQGSVVVDAACDIVWISPQYRELLGLDPDLEVSGLAVEKLLPNTQMPRVVRTGKPLLLDLMQVNQRWCVVTRLPLRGTDQKVIGAIGFVFYDELDSLQPVFEKFSRLRRRFEAEKLLRPPPLYPRQPDRSVSGHAAATSPSNESCSA